MQVNTIACMGTFASIHLALNLNQLEDLNHGKTKTD
jgi:hypothetical protein